jgi:branched-chain amino acid transport system substrate-binding protein
MRNYVSTRRSVRRLRPGAAILAAVAVPVLALTACGSSSPSSSSSSTSGGTEIPVGVIGSYSGPLAATVAPAKPAIEAWAASVNAAGGINGHHIHLYLEDDNGNVQTSLQLVKQLVEQDHVVAIVGQASSAGDAGWASYVEQKGVPVVGGISSDSPYLTNPDFFAAGANQVAAFYGTAALAKPHGAKFGELYCAEIPACASVVPILNGFGKDLGVDVTYSSKVAASSPDFSAACQGLKSSGVNSYGLALGAATLKQVADQCAQQGLRIPLVVTNVVDSNFIIDPALNGTEALDSSFPFFDETIPASKEFHAALAKYEPQLGTTALPLNNQVSWAWVSGKLFEAALKAAGSGPITPATVKTGLYALKDETLGGLSSPLNFTPNQPNLNNCYFTYEVQAGKFVEPNGVKPECAPAGPVTAVVKSF